MAKIIYIATTQGPVRVQAITEEDSDIKSVVCLDGMAEPLAISDRYHDFVKKGTGIIHKKFGHGSYRVDVEKRIDQGNSWQLGLYCAHLLQQENKLTNTQPSSNDTIYFITGSVKSNGEIIPVEKVAEKFQAASPSIKQWCQQGSKVIALLATKQPGIPTAQELKEAGLTIDIKTISNIQEISPLIVANNLPAQAAGGEPAKQPAKSNVRPMVYTLIALLIAFGLYKKAGPIMLDKADTVQPLITSQGIQKKETSLAVQPILIAKQTTGEANCQQAEETTVKQLAKHHYQAISLKNLCSLHWQVANAKALIAFSLDRMSQIKLQQSGQNWRLPLPKGREANRPYVVIAVYDKQSKTLQNRLKRQQLRWELQEITPSLSNIQNWLNNQAIKATAYRHTLQQKRDQTFP